MTTALLALTLTALAPAQPAGKFAGRERHPLAPSLPVLTEKEQEEIERVIERLIEYDIGKLKGAAGAKALADFNALGPEATFHLIEGLNRAAEMEASCPAVLIAKRLALLLRGSDDPALLDFARDNIGAGVKARRHQVVLKDLKVACQLRRSALQRRVLAAKGGGAGKPLRSMSVPELAALAGSERGPRLKLVLAELELRQGPQVIDTLGAAAVNGEKDVRQLASGLLVKYLSRQGPTAVKARFTDERAEVRAAAARVAGEKGLRLGAELIELLGDNETAVRQAARQALVRLSRGQDFGPQPDATAEAILSAMRQWRAWWARQGGR